VSAVRSIPTRRSSRALATVAATVLAALAALVAVGCGGGDDGSDQGYVEPKGPATETIAIDAENFAFAPDDIDAEAGIAEISLTSTGGLHDLVFEDAFPGFRLEAGTGDTDAKKIELERGDYVFYCSLSGHRAAGMEGTLTVS
jgi:plastocyanin